MTDLRLSYLSLVVVQTFIDRDKDILNTDNSHLRERKKLSIRKELMDIHSQFEVQESGTLPGMWPRWRRTLKKDDLQLMASCTHINTGVTTAKNASAVITFQTT